MNKTEVLETIKWLRANKDKITDKQPFEKTIGEDTVSAIFLGTYQEKGEKPIRMTIRQRIAQKKEQQQKEKEKKRFNNALKAIERQKYSNMVRELTKTVNLSLIQGFSNGLLMAANIIECRSEEYYVIDHKISVFNAFNKGVSIEDAAHPTNLRFTTGAKNNEKGMKNLIDDANRWIADKYGIEY